MIITILKLHFFGFSVLTKYGIYYRCIPHKCVLPAFSDTVIADRQPDHERHFQDTDSLVCWIEEIDRKSQREKRTLIPIGQTGRLICKLLL